MAKKMFTEAGLERLRAPDKGRVEYGDSVVPGLMLRISETGVKSWSVLYKVKGEGGASPTTGRPHEGHAAAHLARPVSDPGRQAGARGGDRRAAEVAAAERTRASCATRPCSPADRTRSRPSPSASSTRTPSPTSRAGARSSGRSSCTSIPNGVTAPSPTSAAATCMRCSTVSSPRARPARRAMSASTSRASSTGPSTARSSPRTRSSGLKRKDLQYKADAGRALTDDELRAIWNAAQRMGYPFGPYFQLMILTGQRRTEWADAKHSEVCPKRKVLEIPKARFKGRRDHVVPLAPRGLGHLRRDAPLERRRPLPLQHPGRRGADLRLLEGQDRPSTSSPPRSCGRP